MPDGTETVSYTHLRVRNTVTEFGSVARGVCEVQNGMLMGITERTKIYQRGDHAAYTAVSYTHLADLRRVLRNALQFQICH